MRVCILGSGSSGNSTLVVAGETRVLIDCGLSGRETIKRLQSIGEDPAQIDAIVVTHEHGDHARSLAILSKTLNVPVYISTAALDACKLGERIKTIRRGEAVICSQGFEIGAFHFHPFAIPHDSVDPMAFTVEAHGIKLVMAVDLGEINLLVNERLRGADILIIESNYQPDMLSACGVYPWELKQRIHSRQGHLSNDQVEQFLSNDFDGRAEHIVLAHVSENTNMPCLVEQAATDALRKRSTPFSEDEIRRRVKVAPYFNEGPSEWFEL